MNNKDQRNYASTGTWLLISFIMAIPIAGILVLAVSMGVGAALMKRLRSPTHKA